MPQPRPELQPSQRPASRRRDVRAAFVALAITGGVMYLFSGWLNSERAEEFGPSYAGCATARAAGVAPLLRGQAGYRADLDPDGDGVACDPAKS